MKFLILFIRKNMRCRKANYLLPFLSFVLSGILICTSVFYLTLADNYHILSQTFHPYDMMMKSSGARDDAVIADAMRNNNTFVHGFIQEYIDLLPVFQEEITSFDENFLHKQINFTSIRPKTPLAAFYAANGCDVSVLSSNDIYVTPYMLYYFQNHIVNDILTLPAPSEKDPVFQFRIVGILDQRISDDDNFAVICSDAELFQSMQAAFGTTTSIHYYDFDDGFVHTRENYSDALKNLWPSEDSVNVRLFSSAPIEKSQAIYSGDAAIAVFNIFFSVLCIVSTLKLKLDRELPDYRKLFSLGLSPIMRFLIPFADIGTLILPAYLIAFPFSVLLFSLIAPYTGQTYQSAVITHYFQYSSALLFTTLLLFVGCIAVIAGIMIVFGIIRSSRVRHSYVKQSSRVYASASFHLLPYTFLHIRRNRKYSLFFVFILCFPLFVTAIYGTAAVNLVSDSGGLYADAAYIISRDDVSYGTAVTDQIVRDIRKLTGVDSVQVVHKTNTLYTFESETTSSQAQITELNAYTKDQFSKYLIAGSLDEVCGSSHAIAVVDPHDALSLGDTVTIKQTNRSYTVAAILKHVPMNGRPLTYLADVSVMEDLKQAEILPAEIHVYINPANASADDVLNRIIPSMIYDPHANFVNQKDEISARDENGGVTYRAASAMNVQICIISVLSVFLLHTQKQTERAGEFDILYRLGYSHREIRYLIFAESFILLGIGLGVFAMLYGMYVNSITSAIRETGAYQYSGFSLAWKEIIFISLGMIGVVSISNLLSYKPQKRDIERGEVHENPSAIS